MPIIAWMLSKRKPPYGKYQANKDGDEYEDTLFSWKDNSTAQTQPSGVRNRTGKSVINTKKAARFATFIK